MDETIEFLRDRIESLKAAWMAGSFDELPAFYAPDAVMMAPGFAERVRGREAIVETYRTFSAAAKIERLQVGSVTVDVWGDTALAVAPFDIDYAVGEDRFHEEGHDLLVFQSREGEWLVVWRSTTSGETTDVRD